MVADSLYEQIVFEKKTYEKGKKLVVSQHFSESAGQHQTTAENDFIDLGT
jgi:hypothetical protein